MCRRVKHGIILSVFIIVLFSSRVISSAPFSPQTETCIACHNVSTSGIVHDWLKSKHSKTTLEEALKKPPLERRISNDNPQKELMGYAVGCYECHSQNPDSHKDNFSHFGLRINVIVTPNDCKSCHPIEAEQFSGSKKAHAFKNLMENNIYRLLVDTVTGIRKIEDGVTISSEPSRNTLHETCLGCHGTKVEVKGIKTINMNSLEINIPDLTNWPNQGVGRENPDGSLGACSSCHTRHSFSIELARKPYTCSQCHLEPDVPAWNVYKESKHGNIYFSKYHEWSFDSVPWVIGKDFQSPTCSTCHNSLLVSPNGDIVFERTHDFGSRLWVRLFGLIYSHPQPESGNTTIIKNKDAQPLPTTFLGEPASEYLINKSEKEKRLSLMKNLCKTCHSTDWINGHFSKLENTIRETDEMTLSATKLILNTWEKGVEDNINPFDELIEKMWARQWLFYSNSIRYASAMTGAPDYTAFKNGWWYLNENLQQMKDLIDLKEKKKAE
jgi:hypothetical protein